MRMVLASSFSNALLGGLAVWGFLTVGNILVWAAVIAWGCFFHTGGNPNALRITIAGNCLGILSAWIAGLLLTLNPAFVPAPIWAGVMVGLVTMGMVFLGHQMGIHFKMTVLVVPACFYGAAATFAYIVQTPGALTQASLLSLSMHNALIVLPISMAIGAFLGYATALMTVALGTPARPAVAAKDSSRTA